MKMTAKFEAEGENFNTCFEQLNSAFNAEFSASGGGQDGKDGATFIPSVSDDGVISWTNDKGLDNPDPVNIKGDKGEKGEQGIQGIPGVPGADGAKGDKGDKGDPGTNGKDGADGKNGIDGKDGVNGKDGIDGKNGIDGEDGFSPVVAVDDIENGHRVTITDKDGAKTFDVMNGKDGVDGYTPVKGKDYFTEADKAEMVQAVLTELPSEVWTITYTDGTIEEKEVALL